MENRQDRLIELIESMLSSGWNQTSLSRAIGVSQPTIGRWLAGKNLPEPSSNNFKGLARATGGTAESLLLYLDSEISLDEYLSSGTKYSRTPEQIKADILRLDPTEIAAVIAFSAEVLAKKFQYPSTDTGIVNLSRKQDDCSGSNQLVAPGSCTPVIASPAKLSVTVSGCTTPFP